MTKIGSITDHKIDYNGTGLQEARDTYPAIINLITIIFMCHTLILLDFP